MWILSEKYQNKDSIFDTSFDQTICKLCILYFIFKNFVNSNVGSEIQATRISNLYVIRPDIKTHGESHPNGMYHCPPN